MPRTVKDCHRNKGAKSMELLPSWMQMKTKPKANNTPIIDHGCGQLRPVFLPVLREWLRFDRSVAFTDTIVEATSVATPQIFECNMQIDNFLNIDGSGVMRSAN